MIKMSLMAGVNSGDMVYQAWTIVQILENKQKTSKTSCLVRDTRSWFPVDKK